MRNILTVLFLIDADEHKTTSVRPFPKIPMHPTKTEEGNGMTESKYQAKNALLNRGGSRIFERGRHSRRGRQPIIWPIFPKNCMKMKTVWPGGGARFLRPLGPPMLDTHVEPVLVSFLFTIFPHMFLGLNTGLLPLTYR